MQHSMGSSTSSLKYGEILSSRFNLECVFCPNICRVPSQDALVRKVNRHYIVSTDFLTSLIRRRFLCLNLCVSAFFFSLVSSYSHDENLIQAVVCIGNAYRLQTQSIRCSLFSYKWKLFIETTFNVCIIKY